MRKFGGPGKKKKCCISRKCLQPTFKETKNVTTAHVSSTNSVPVAGKCIHVLQIFKNVHTSFMYYFFVGKLHSLESFLAQCNRKVKGIKGDGNCFFRALSFILFNNEDEDYAIRSIIVRFENLNGPVFESRMTTLNEPTFKQHINKMLRPGAWATHIELQAAAAYFQLPIYFCQDPPPPNRMTYCWQVIKPIDAPDTFHYPVQVDPLFEGISLPTHFEVLYDENWHFSCIVTLDGNLSTVAPVLDGPVVYAEEVIQ